MSPTLNCDHRFYLRTPLDARTTVSFSINSVSVREYYEEMSMTVYKGYHMEPANLQRHCLLLWLKKESSACARCEAIATLARNPKSRYQTADASI